MFRVPIWMTSAASSTASAFSVSISSVTMPMPVFSRARCRIFSPSIPIPWKAYGLVRGLNAPARNSFTPFDTRNSAVRRIIASFSTEHGPATTVNAPGPNTPCGVFTTVLGLILVSTGDLASLADTTVLLLLCAFAIVNVAVLVLRRDEVSHPHFRAPTIAPILGAIVCVVLIVDNEGEIFLRAGLLLVLGAALWALARLGGHRPPDGSTGEGATDG